MKFKNAEMQREISNAQLTGKFIDLLAHNVPDASGERAMRDIQKSIDARKPVAIDPSKISLIVDALTAGISEPDIEKFIRRGTPSIKKAMSNHFNGTEPDFDVETRRTNILDIFQKAYWNPQGLTNYEFGVVAAITNDINTGLNNGLNHISNETLDIMSMFLERANPEAIGSHFLKAVENFAYSQHAYGLDYTEMDESELINDDPTFVPGIEGAKRAKLMQKAAKVVSDVIKKNNLNKSAEHDELMGHHMAFLDALGKHVGRNDLTPENVRTTTAYGIQAQVVNPAERHMGNPQLSEILTNTGERDFNHAPILHDTGVQADPASGQEAVPPEFLSLNTSNPTKEYVQQALDTLGFGVRPGTDNASVIQNSWRDHVLRGVEQHVQERQAQDGTAGMPERPLNTGMPMQDQQPGILATQRSAPMEKNEATLDGKLIPPTR